MRGLERPWGRERLMLSDESDEEACGSGGNREVAGSIPGSSWPSVEVSLSQTPHPTAPDELAVALRGRLRRRGVNVIRSW